MLPIRWLNLRYDCEKMTMPRILSCRMNRREHEFVNTVTPCTTSVVLYYNSRIMDQEWKEAEMCNSSLIVCSGKLKNMGHTKTVELPISKLQYYSLSNYIE